MPNRPRPLSTIEEKMELLDSPMRAEHHLPVPVPGSSSRPVGTIESLRMTLFRSRYVLFAVQSALLLTFVVGVFGWSADARDHGMDSFAASHNVLAKRYVVMGRDCPDHHRHQLNAFLAALLGGLFAADQWYARNFQLAIPKLIVMIMGGVSVTGATLLGSIPFAWWLLDTAFWGIGVYTTDTHFGNPVKGCALVGW